MICRTARGTAQESVYSISPKSKELDYSAAMRELLRTASIDVATKELEDAYALAKESAESHGGLDSMIVDKCAMSAWFTRPLCVTVVSEYAQQEIGKLLRVYHGPQGPEWLCRVSAAGTVFQLAASPYIGLQQAGEAVYLAAQTLLARLHFNCQLWSFRILDENSGEVLRVLSANQYAAETLKIWVAGDSDELRELKKQQQCTPENLAKIGGELVRYAMLTERLSTSSPEKLRDASSGAEHMIPEPKDCLQITLGQNWLSRALEDMSGLWEKDLPKVITNNPNETAFSFFDFNALHSMDTPSFDNWVSRIAPECRELFMALVFAPLVADCRHRKVCWIRSEGYDGKSAFFRALNTYTGGNLTGSINTASLTDTFGLSSAIGKRILIMGDCQNRHLLKTNAIHNMTGGDSVQVNRKNQSYLEYSFRSMVFVGANDTPEIELHQPNSTTRIAYVPMDPPTDEQLKHYAKVNSKGEIMRQSDGTPLYIGSDFEKRLVEEMPGILFKCREQYHRLCPTGNEILIPPRAYDRMLQDCGSANGDDLAHYAATHLSFDPEAEIECAVLIAHFCRIRKIGKTDSAISDFGRWLAQKGVHLGRKERPHRIRIYRGVRLKDE